MDLDVRSHKALVVLMVVFLVVCAVLLVALTLDRPRITAVDNDWGTVTENRTEIETQVTVKHPRILELGDTFVNVEYTISLNDIEIVHGQKQAVPRSGEQQNVITVSTWANNDDIPEWWITHINRNQTTSVRIDPKIVTEYGGLRFPVESWTQTRTVNTNLLEPLQTSEIRRFHAFNRTLLSVNKTAAHWGRATAEQTPLTVSATVSNPRSNPIPIINIGYTIRMNGIRVGHSVTDNQTVIPPHSTKKITSRAFINNSRLDEWWVTHLRHNETTRLTVDFYATTEYNGERRRVPLDFLTYQRTFQTQIFNANESIKRADRDIVGELPLPLRHSVPR